MITQQPTGSWEQNQDGTYTPLQNRVMKPPSDTFTGRNVTGTTITAGSGGVVLTSPNGTRYRIVVSNTGTLSTVAL